MDLFPDGAFVRLQNRVQQKYLYADDDGEGVSVRPYGHVFSLNAVWRVHRVLVAGNNIVLLQGVAYGRYLAISPGMAPPGYRGRRAVQRDYAGDNVGALMWNPLRIVAGERYVRLRNEFNRNLLRANGRYRTWHTAVTADIDDYGRLSTMMQWTVHRFQVYLGGRRGLLGRRMPEADERRTIRHVRANNEGDFDQDSNNWPTFNFFGRSVFNLRIQVGMRQPGGEVWAITMAVRPGSQGRLTPLVTDLPRSVDNMDIVVFDTGSQGAQNLVYPAI
ncbi:hypothetical protein Zm00014a_017026 [Zea mays]|uniref:Uncharacterized protein n=1 Tax=Zea mays TaxID=4577 RepID=A0A3L6D8C4_MAIZE|nr:hypothetical protein Zm00014a_017026 [Zea mays]